MSISRFFLAGNGETVIHRPFWIFKKIIISYVLISIFLLQAPGHAGAAFTIEDEKKLGKEIYEKISKQKLLLQDDKVNDYITRLGNMILSQSGNVIFTFQFSVVDSSAINAFATPGGYIYINKGLINLVEKESELAGVIAHEIAHANARHVASQIEKGQVLSIATLATVLAGALLGGGGAGTQAAIAFSMATQAHLSLKYSREDEEEADRMGISYLVKTGYDGKGMVTFLKAMKNYEFYSSSLPSYFLTHPGTDDRMNYLNDLLLTTYRKRGADNLLGGLKRIQTYLMLGNMDLNPTLKYFQNRLSKDPRDVDALYGLAVAQGKLGKTSESFDNFSKALTLAPDDVDILRDMGIAYFNNRRTSDAIAIMRRAYALNERDEGTLLYLGQAYSEAGDYGMALDFYKKYREKKPDDVDSLYNIAIAYGKNGNRAESHYNFSLFFKKKNKRESALFHLKEAQKYVLPNSELAYDIQKLQKELESPRTEPNGPPERPGDRRRG